MFHDLLAGFYVDDDILVGFDPPAIPAALGLRLGFLFLPELRDGVVLIDDLSLLHYLGARSAV